MHIAEVAKICHEANRAYCETLGDVSQPKWEEAPDWQKDSAKNGVEFHLQSLRAGQKPDPASSHINWLKEKAEAGWKYGTVKDAEAKTHPCFVPYEDLPPSQRAKDYIFCAIVEAVFSAGLLGNRSELERIDRWPSKS